MGSDADDDFEVTRPLPDSSPGLDDKTRPRAQTGPARLRALSPMDVIDGRYDVKATLGEGSMGVVYLARERALDRPVAIKTIAPAWAHEPKFANSFLEEARAMARIRHSNVVQLYTSGEHEGCFYLAMEFVKGSSLQAVLKSHRARGELLSIHNMVAVLDEVIGGVGAIHEAGLLHCDLRPANIVVEDDTGRAVVIDFGVATRARSGDAQLEAGSPAYMAPEQFSDSPALITEQSDIYALGVTAFELLTGELPFRGASYRAMVDLHRSAPVPRMSAIRPALDAFDAFVARALAKDSVDRYTSCAEMRAALSEAQSRWSQRMSWPAAKRLSSPGVQEVNVLVVDDDPNFRKAAARAARLAFADKSIRVLPAGSGEQALAIAARRMPNIVLLDYMLPNLDGVTTLSAMRSLPHGHDVRVVVISGSVDEVRWRFTALGVKDFLAKPVGLDELIETVQGIVLRAGWQSMPQWE